MYKFNDKDWNAMKTDKVPGEKYIYMENIHKDGNVQA